ncbi:MAG: hypothetical protein AAGA65_17730 [Actinomycetota bacterium]
MEHQPKPGEALNDREALGISLAERMALDPHTVTDDFFAKLNEHFSEDEIVEMVFACGIFNWGNKFNITMNMDSSDESAYEKDMEYRREEIDA